MNNNKTGLYEDDGIDFSRFFALLLKHRFFIAVWSGSLSCIILLFLLVTEFLPADYNPFPNVYKPYSTILIKEDSTTVDFSKLLFPASSLGSSGVSLSKFNFGELAIKLIQSNSIIDLISNEFKIAERYRITEGKKNKSREEVLKHLGLEYEEKNLTLTVSYEDYDPAFASRLVNRVVEELSSKLEKLDIARNLGQKNTLDTKISEVQATIRSLEADIVGYQKKYGFLQVQTLAEEQITTSAQVRLQLMNKEMEIRTKKDLLNIDDSEMKKLYAERDTLQKLIAELEGGFSTYSGVVPSQKELPEVARAFNRLQRELAVQVKIYELLVQQHELTKLSLAGFLPMVQVIDVADVPDYKSGPQRTLIFIIGVLVSVVTAMLAMIIRNSIKNISDIIGAKESRKK